MNEYYDFLMNELKDVVDSFESDNERARELCVVMSLGPQPIPETFYRLYIANLQIDPVYVKNAVSYFMGLGKLEIDCDCSPEDKSICDILEMKQSPHFFAGQTSCFAGDNEYDSISSKISTMRLEVFSE